MRLIDYKRMVFLKLWAYNIAAGMKNACCFYESVCVIREFGYIANYYMMNEKTYQKYSDKFRLAVVDLTQIELATEEDRAYQIEQWAQFFYQ